MARSTTSRSREKRINPHKLLGQIAKAESDFQTRRYKLAVRNSSTGEVSYDQKKLEGLIADFAIKRGELIRSWEKHHTPLLFSWNQHCCCCCCCEEESVGESWVKDLDYSKYILFDSQGVTDNYNPNDDKTAFGCAGDAQLSGPPDRSLSRISFGFRTSFNLPFDFNELTIRSGVHLELGWIETQSFSIYSIGQVQIFHQIHVVSGAFQTSQTAHIFMQMSPPNGGIGGLSGEERNSELAVEFERSGQGSSIIVDEAIVIEARRFGTTNLANAVAGLWSRYEPLHVAIRRGT